MAGRKRALEAEAAVLATTRERVAAAGAARRQCANPSCDEAALDEPCDKHPGRRKECCSNECAKHRKPAGKAAAVHAERKPSPATLPPDAPVFTPPPPARAAVEDFEPITESELHRYACALRDAGLEQLPGETRREDITRWARPMRGDAEALQNCQCMKNTVNAMYGRELFTVEAMNVLSIIAGRDLSRATLESESWQALKLPHGTFGLDRDWAARLMEVLFPNRAGVEGHHFEEVTREDQKRRLIDHKQSWFKYYHRNTGKVLLTKDAMLMSPYGFVLLVLPVLGAVPHFTAVRMRPRAPSSSDPILWDLWNGQHTEADRTRMGELGMTDAMLAKELNEKLASGQYTIFSLRSTHKPSEADLRERQLQSIIMSISANHGGKYSTGEFRKVPRSQTRGPKPARPRGQGHRAPGAKRHRGSRQ